MENNIHVPEDLLAELQSKDAMEGKSLDELAAEALRRGLEDSAWRDLLEYGQKTGRESGYHESDVPDYHQTPPQHAEALSVRCHLRFEYLRRPSNSEGFARV